MCNGGVNMNNRVHLNDIRLDLFLKYFTSEDLDVLPLNPVILNDQRKFFKYSFDVNTVTYNHFSVYDSLISTTEIQEEIVAAFSDIIPSIEISDIEDLTKLTLATINSTQAYITQQSNILAPNRYYFEYNNGDIRDFVYITINDILTENITATSPILGVDITDVRTGIDILTNGKLLSAVEDGVNYFIVINASEQTIGSLRPNTLKTIQKTDTNGNLLFLNEANEEVIEFERRSNFLAHNRAVRKSAFLLNDPLEIITINPSKFDEGKVGMFKLGEEQIKLVFFQNFLKTVKYEKINDLENFTAAYITERVSPALKTAIPTDGSPYVELDEVPIPKFKEVDSILDLKKVNASFSIIDNIITFTSLNTTDIFVLNENVIITITGENNRKIEYIGKVQVVSNNGRTCVLTKYNNPNLEKIPFNNSTFSDSSLYGYTSPNIYQKIIYIKDEIDPSYLVKKTEIIEAPLTNASNSIIANTSTSNPFMTLDFFQTIFSIANHLKIDRYYELRGSLISNDSIYNIKKSVILEMLIDYMGRNSDFFVAKGVSYSQNALWKMRIIAESFKKIAVIKNRENTFVKRKTSVSFNDLKKGLFIAKLEPILKDRTIRDYLEVDFSTEITTTLNEVNSLNSFQKILDYKNYPYNQKRIEVLSEQKKRETIFNDFQTNENAPDDYVKFNNIARAERVGKLEFKQELVSLLSDLFFSVNDYEVNKNFYINSFYRYLKNKLKATSEFYFQTENADLLEKKVFLKENIKANNNILLEKIFSKSENWKVI
jgi:hypothetical protein